MNNYYKLLGFSNVYLEDSFVILISEYDDKLIFDMEFVIKEGHPLFEIPKADEYYCYRRGKLIFSDVHSVNWKIKSSLCFHDANYQDDYGNIDVFRKLSNDTYQLSGDWGSVFVISSQVEITFYKI